mmetsp:Transcript_87790/g.221001  ORF Transcript_87790/g.221001 Transcript_87790/m.221001 type:complete len:685 (+) Transcript_87790:29-2083(+)|eukprot:CAMPEP_0115581722 /NCGR_PEP_ID=MMETSP0272-20121206/5295_1 /TAXON_ID=71861 /ORGANISM="Scrippsiella trochoidea, Strain CCMP3099" /LENGTH=684 /DNA_ID=CAMNT_0003016695 /DNA_START=28 /DNA_END=2082 /DNA_ORIENTATION=-
MADDSHKEAAEQQAGDDYHQLKDSCHAPTKQHRPGGTAQSILSNPRDFLARYSLKLDLPGDVVSGLTLGSICLAQTLAHAVIATTDPIQGPYCAFAPAIAYAFLGTSPHASVSSGAIAAILIADQLRPWSSIEDRTAMASLLALLSGLALIIMGLCRLAYATRFLSKPTLSGFITGGSLLIIANQLPKLLGLTQLPSAESLVARIYVILQHFSEVNLVVTALGIALLLFMEALKKTKTFATRQMRARPSARWLLVLKLLGDMKEMLVVVAGITFAYLTAQPSGVPSLPTVGSIPSGLPPLALPWENAAAQKLLSDTSKLQSFALGAVLVALTTFLTTFSTAEQVAQKAGMHLDPSQEMIALGGAGVAGSFFGAFPPSGSLSRTGLSHQLGVRTQLSGLVSATVIGFGLVFLPPVLYYLPTCALAAIILNGSRALIDFDTAFMLMKFWKPKAQGGLKRDLVIWCIAFACTVQLGVLYGVVFAVIVSVCLIVADAAAPPAVTLGILERFGGVWRSVENFPEAETYPGVLVFEFRGPLSFASADWFKEQIEKRRGRAEAGQGSRVRVVVLSFYCVTTMDSTALAMLQELLSAWRGQGISCIAANAQGQVQILLREEFGSGPNPLLDQSEFLINISDAVQRARRLVGTHAGGAPQSTSFHSAATRIQRMYQVWRRQDAVGPSNTLPAL